MLVHVKTLSLWEAAHYWHDFDPRESTTHQLPLVVSHTLQVLSMWCGKKVAYRVEREKAYLLELIGHAPRFTARHYRQTFKKAIDNKVFGKRFFSNMFISRSQLARLCVAYNEPLPEFWFPDNEKHPYDMDGDLADEVSVDGRYVLVMIYDDTAKPCDETVKEQPIVTTVSSNAVKAARAKHAHRNAIKEKFINFYQAEGSNFSTRTAAAEQFFDLLDEKQEKLLFEHRDAAINTLLGGLRTHLKQAKTSK